MPNDNELIQSSDYYICVNSGVTYSIGDVLKRLVFIGTLDYQLRDVWYNTSTGALVSPEPNVSLDLELFNPSSLGELYRNWEYISGNQVDYTWVTGSTGVLVDTITYKKGVTTVLTQSFTYDIEDNLTNISVA
jgi:hypothetical protein